MLELIDSHAHLDASAFDSDRDEVLGRARSAGIRDIVLVAAPRLPSEIGRPLEMARTDPHLWATVGVHPHEAELVDDRWWAELERLASDDKVVAIGETGLDYWYDHSPHEVQKQVFAGQLELCKRIHKPVVCHVRDSKDGERSAHTDAYEMLRQSGIGQSGQPTGIIHCFTGGPEDAARYVSLGLYISFSGIVTFGSAGPIREAIREVPRDRILVETDCPYLAPVPKRGKRNEPAYVVHTAQAVADVLEVPLADLAADTCRNTRTVFALTGE